MLEHQHCTQDGWVDVYYLKGTIGSSVGCDGRFGYGNSLVWGECSQSHEMEGPFTFLRCLVPFLFGHILNDPNDYIPLQKYLELRGIIDCSSHDLSWDSC